MNKNQRFSLLTFPQFFDGTDLTVNIVVLPRDQNPLSPAIEPPLIINSKVESFAEAKLFFTASIFEGLSVFPHNHAPISAIPLKAESPTNAEAIFKALASQLNITNLNSKNIDLENSIPKEFQPAPARPEELTVKKYLPNSYRKSFNFTTPRHKNAVTDDSYHCAIKAGKMVPDFKRSSDKVSWGKVFAYLMRQPQLARHAGMIYQTKLRDVSKYFLKGGWLYIDLAQKSVYRKELDFDHTFIRRYAARIPKLVPGTSRQTFAALLFPVLFKAQVSDPDPVPGSNYDELFIETAEYDDGFAKIVHCQQPPNRDLLVEDNDGAHPVKDVGIRLGWDDEQILIWYIRQMSQTQADPSVKLSGRLDAPLGVFGYNIDVRETATPENIWESLNYVKSKQPLTLSNLASPDDAPISLDTFQGELPYQVYPLQVDGNKKLNYWLPMYFANWVGHSMVLPDSDAANIYQTTNKGVKNDPVKPDPKNTNNDLTGTGVSGPANNKLNTIYSPGTINTGLRYGHNYEFRIRMQDLSGGTPPLETNPVNETASDIANCRFKRFISPNQPRIQEMQALANKDGATKITELNIQRPKLGYPAVVYTGKYSDPIQRLMDQAKLGIPFDKNNPTLNAEHRVGLGIADPDVNRLEITVEIASLKLDKLDSVSGKEDYVHLYTTYRSFPDIVSDDDYEVNLQIPIEYLDVKVLHTGDEVNLVNDFKLSDDIDRLKKLVLPTGRTARFTIRAVCEDKEENKNYYGFINDGNKLFDNRYGEPFQLMAYSPSGDETGLLNQTAGVPALQGIFMQPDVITAHDGKLITILLGKQTSRQRNNVQQLADQLNIESSKLTLSAPKGERVVFGCSSRIRHTMAPDNSSITFASKGDLINHWLSCISFEIDRDWMWDALENRSFIIRRRKKYSQDEKYDATEVLEECMAGDVVGDIEMVRTASFESLHNPQRNSTRIVFIDAVEPKKEIAKDGAEPDFPDTIELCYSIKVNFKEKPEQNDAPEILRLQLPITNPPVQVPKIVSAGIALSPYVRNKNYSYSEARRRHLWIEFEEPVKDPQDTYFARVLAITPDQLLSNNNPELLAAPEESALPIAPEYIRTFSEGTTNDLAGLQAMQPMEKSTTSDRHYLLPLPPGLHAESDEMFGFFTYELRLGHYRNSDTGVMVWTTAQGRFGRRLRATGIQHPAPTLTCMPNRDGDKLWVTAPYAVAVHEGKNVTADPPRTQLWALLYAQVTQADNKDYRNILLDDRQLDWRVQVETEKDTNVLEKYNNDQLQVLRSIAFRSFKYETNAAGVTNLLKLIDFSARNKDAVKYGTVVWSNSETVRLLANLGLPQDSSLSVLVVETLPQITNIFEHISRLDKPKVAQAVASLVNEDKDEFRQWIIAEAKRLSDQDVGKEKLSPVSDELGHHRLLRTSPLTGIPDICSH